LLVSNGIIEEGFLYFKNHINEIRLLNVKWSLCYSPTVRPTTFH